MHTLAPIIVFVYNRPWHTRKTLQALKANALAAQSELHIYCDGPRDGATAEDLRDVQETRAVAREENWCKTVKVHESERNMGLADSIIKGVTETVNRCGRVIVLEDDIITSPGFLTYMNEALTLYEADDKVMHVSGYMFPVKGSLPGQFFYPPTTCWGWGTWQRAWKHFSNEPRQLLQQLETQNKFLGFDLGGNSEHGRQLKANVEGTMKTWAVRWYASVYLNDGLSLHPFPSLTNNIGMDGTGENCHTTDKYSWPSLAPIVRVKRVPFRNSKKAIKLMHEFYGKPVRSRFRKTVSRTLKKLGLR